MSWEAWLTLAVMTATIVVLTRGLLPASATMITATVVLLISGVIDSHEALAGFSNPAPVTVAALYILARAVEKTRALQPFIHWFLEAKGGVRRGLSRLLAPCAAASAFLNNTPIVAMLVPTLIDATERRGVSPSRYLMPLSFAVVLGGCVTLIGTSTNVLVSSLLQSAGQAPLAMFELAPVGLPLAIVGVVLIIVIAPIVLPERRAAHRDLVERVREFAVNMEVIPTGPLDGKAVEEGGLRHLRSVFLVQLERGGQIIAPVTPATTLRGGDILTFVGKVDDIVDLQSVRGLRADGVQTHPFDTARLGFFEVVLGATSKLVGRTLKDYEFRNRYQAAVVAIHRAGQRVDAKLGSVRLRAGDTLLLLADPGFRDRWRDQEEFLLVSRLGGATLAATRKAPVVALVALAVVLVAGAGWLPILHVSLVGALALVAFGVLTPAEVREAIDFDVLLVIAASFALGAAIHGSGLAALVAHGLVSLFSPLGPMGILAGFVVATVLLTELVTNNAAAALLFPIGIEVTSRAHLDVRPFAIALAIAASASFLTPIGYQTNMMVYGPGGYRFGDYTRLGAPLTLLMIAVVLGVVPLVWPL